MAELQPAIWRIVRDAIRDAPPEVRTGAVAALTLWIGMIILQAVDSADRSGAPAVAEFLSALCGSVSGLLLGLCGLLNAAAERRTRAGDPADQAGFRRILLALPVIGLAAAAFAAAAVVLVAVRGLLGVAVPFVLVLGLFFFLLLVFSASMTLRATRTLYAHAQAEAAAAAQARLGARDAQVAALQARMSPHFLFNALNTIASLIRTDSTAAERATEHLSEILRTTLHRSAASASTVGEEVSHIRAWLALEQLRFAERLRVRWDIDPRAGALSLPPLSIQPLVENSLRHGIGGRIEGGTIEISIRGDADVLRITVTDDGAGFPAVYREGTGLRNLRERLHALHGTAARLEVHRPPTGASVSLHVPCAPVPCAP
jgi:hypothetical protein